jgi:hypothetical protein
MSFIIKHESNISDIPYYVRLVDNKEFEEIYDPSYATRFKTELEARNWIDTYSSMADHSKIVDTANAISEYQKWAESGTVRRVLSCVNTSMSRPYNNEPLDEVIDWWIYNRRNNDEIKYEHSKTWPELYKLSNYLLSVTGAYTKNYDDVLITFEIYTSQNGKFEDFENDINRVIDKVTYKDDNGFLIFPIFDHYLSEHGNSVSLLIHPDTKEIKIGTHHWCEGVKYKSLEEAFNYMKKERYYE